MVWPLGGLALSSQVQAQDSLFFENVMDFDGQRKIESTNVLTERGTIKDLGPNVKSLERSIKVDGTGKTLIPGLIDSHNHPYCPLRARSWKQKLCG